MRAGPSPPRGYVADTGHDWYSFLAQQLKSPHDAFAGFGYFTHHQPVFFKRADRIPQPHDWGGPTSIACSTAAT